MVGDRAHAREEIGVAREVGGRGARDEKSDRRRPDAERPAPAFVLGVRRVNGYAAYLRFISGVDLDHVAEATSPQPRAGAARNDELRGAPKRLKRRDVEVVVVDMRNQHRIDETRVEPQSLSYPPQMEHPPSCNRVGQQADALELHEDRAVTEPGETLARFALGSP